MSTQAMGVSQVETLLAQLRQLPAPPAPEPTVFSIGGRGYYENPTTDVLAFFCDPDAAHGLGDIVLRALFTALPDIAMPESLALASPPAREQVADGKRIDLLLEGSDWLMVIENKIYHEQNNPFEVYEAFAREKARARELPEESEFYVVLSPSGKSERAGWQGLSYSALLAALKQELADSFISAPLNKWMVLLRDFIVHLENLMNDTSRVRAETVNYVLEHLADISQVMQLKEQAMRGLQADLHEYLSAQFPDQEIGMGFENWSGYPALRFYLSSRKAKTEVVLYLDANSGKPSHIYHYIYELSSDQQRAEADAFMAAIEPKTVEAETRKTIRKYGVSLPNHNIGVMKDALLRALQAVERFEQDVRRHW